MPIIALYVKADLENIASFKPPEDHLWRLDIQNSAGGELRENVMLDPSEEMDLKGSKGTANLIMKDGNREHSMSVVEVKGLVKPLTPDASGDGWVPIVAFECRGIEPIKWHPTDGYEIVSTGGTAFDDVDLAEDPTMWADYCAKLGEPVSMSNLEWRFDILKGAKVVGKS
jgi:hypothetical protein